MLRSCARAPVARAAIRVASVALTQAVRVGARVTARAVGPLASLPRSTLARRSFASAAAPTSTKPGSLYDPVFRRSIDQGDAYWLEKASALRWSKKGTTALSTTGPRPHNYRWFADGWEGNVCDNMVDLHVDNGLGDKTAIIYDSAMTGEQRSYTYSQLQDEVSRLAGALREAGVGKGDRVLIYMPMIPQTIFGMLAVTRLAGIHSVVFGGFPAAELAKRIQDAQPTVILTASCGLESPTRIIQYKPALDEAIRLSKCTPKKVLVFQRPQCKAELTEGRDVEWNSYVKEHGKPTACVTTKATDPIYILYTSGTTGMPKGVVRDFASAVALKASMQMVYGHDQNNVYWSASDLGWAVGHSYTVYGPLLQGTTSVLYEGKPVGTPDCGAFWRVIQKHKVAVLFTAPTALRAIKKEDAEGAFIGKYDISSLQALFLAGERADPASLTWAREKLGVPVIDHWWQTETGWGIVGNPRGIELMPVKDGSSTRALPGWDVHVVDDDGHEVARGVQGNLVIKLPLPPSGLNALWNDEARFTKSYMDRFPGYYDTADAGRMDEDGYVYIMARTDDVMNVAGHRLSSGQMEEVLQDHPAVAESAVVAVPDALRGHVPVGLVVLKTGVSAEREAALEAEAIASVRARVGAVACFRRVLVVPRLPKTRSGKVLRGVLRAMAEGRKNIPVPPTIEDESVIAEVRKVLTENGLGVEEAKQ